MQFISQIFFNGSTRGLASVIIAYFLNDYLPGVYQLIIAPFTDPQMLWILMPLIASTVLMQLYFGRYRQEELGWNTAFGNSIMLIFVSVNLFQHLYGILGAEMFNDSRFYLISSVLVVALIQLVLNFFHKIAEKYAFRFSSSAFVNILAYIMIILTYKQFNLDITTLLSSITVFCIIYAAMAVVKYLAPMSSSAKNYVNLENEKKKIKKKNLDEATEEREKTKEASPVYFKYALFASLAISIFVPYLLEFSGLYEFSAGLAWLIYIVPSSAILVVSIYLIKKEQVSFSQFNYNKKAKNVFSGVVAGFLVFCSFSVIDYVISVYFPGLTTQELSFGSYGLIFAIVGVFVSSIADELLFRGIIQRFLKGKMTKSRAITLQSAVYSISYISISQILAANYHMEIITFFVLLVLGLVNGSLREKAGLEAGIGSAVAYRALVVLALVL